MTSEEGWIDVKERLPKPTGSEKYFDCLTLVDGRSYNNTFVFKKNEWIGFNSKVTHWKKKT